MVFLGLEQEPGLVSLEGFQEFIGFGLDFFVFFVQAFGCSRMSIETKEDRIRAVPLLSWVKALCCLRSRSCIPRLNLCALLYIYPWLMITSISYIYGA